MPSPSPKTVVTDLEWAARVDREVGLGSESQLAPVTIIINTNLEPGRLKGGRHTNIERHGALRAWAEGARRCPPCRAHGLHELGSGPRSRPGDPRFPVLQGKSQPIPGMEASTPTRANTLRAVGAAIATTTARARVVSHWLHGAAVTTECDPRPVRFGRDDEPMVGIAA